MKIKVVDSMCIGCGACVGTCPEEFDFNDEGISVPKNETVKEENKEAVKDAKDSCPTNAIKLENE